VTNHDDNDKDIYIQQQQQLLQDYWDLFWLPIHQEMATLRKQLAKTSSSTTTTTTTTTSTTVSEAVSSSIAASSLSHNDDNDDDITAVPVATTTLQQQVVHQNTEEEEDATNVLLLLLQQQYPTLLYEEIVPHMQEIYQNWNMLYRERQDRHPTTTTTTMTNKNTPYQIMLNVYTGHSYHPTHHSYSEDYQQQHLPTTMMTSSSSTSPPLTTTTTTTHDPRRALQIVQDWELNLGGHLDLAPTHVEYQKVLRAYAAPRLRPSSSGCSSSTSTSTNSSSHELELLLPLPPYPESVDVALEIMEHLEQSYPVYDPSRFSEHHLPNLYTYQYVIRCISRAMRYQEYIERHGPPTDHDNNSTSTDEAPFPMKDYFLQLQSVMDKYIQQLPLPITTKITHEQFASFMITLSDVIRCYKIVQSLDLFQDAQQQQQHPGDSSNNGTPDPNLLGLDRTLTYQRQNELFLYWWRFVQPGNADLWLNITDDSTWYYDSATLQQQHQPPPPRQHYQNGFAILERTTSDIMTMWNLELRHSLDSISAATTTTTNTSAHHHDENGAATATFENCLGIVETMTQHLLQLDDMMRTSMGPFLPSGRHFKRSIHSWRAFMKHDKKFKYHIIGQQQLAIVLQRMEEQHHRNHSAPESTVEHEFATSSWNNLLQSYLDARFPDKVIELWNKNKRVKFGRIRRNQESFTILLIAYAAKRQSDTYPQARERAQQAHSVLSKLVTYDSSVRLFEPTSTHFASVMLAWGRSYHFNAAKYCQQVFDFMLEESERRRSKYASMDAADETVDMLVPTATHYRSLIVTWGYSRLPEAMQRVTDLYEHMKSSDLIVDVSTYATVLFALSRTRSVMGAQKAEEILDQLENEAAVAASNAARHSSSSTTNNHRLENFEDDEIVSQLTCDCYKSVMYAWGYSGAPDAHAKCAKIFRRLMTAYEQSGWHTDFRPDSTTYAILIDSMAALENTSPSDYVTQAEKVLDQMEVQSATGLSPFPNSRVYTAVMKAHWKSGQPNAAMKVEDLIRRMKASYEAGNVHAKPDNHVMTILLQTWAKSDVPNKATITWEIYKEMQNAYNSGDLKMRPNHYTLGSVLNACAFTNSPEESIKSEAVKIALMALNEFDKGTDGGLNDYAFRHMFQVIANQIDDISDRTLHANVIFQKCCQAGLLSQFSLNVIRNHVPALFYQLPMDANKNPIIPQEWSRNIKEKTFETEAHVEL
jgi:PPR repeat